ncbi:MAG: hypothetical protein Kow0074_04670 [Candidatus Zixiibacteriota bacterium]
MKIRIVRKPGSAISGITKLRELTQERPSGHFDSVSHRQIDVYLNLYEKETLCIVACPQSWSY